MEEIKKRLQEIFVQALRRKMDPSEVGETGLVSRLGIDSINSLEVLIWVEDEFKVTIEDEDLSPQLVDSLDNLAAYIVKKQAAATQVS
ncbi:MAG: acyl carrier protein [bacterium]|nr:acyl carrier protein [bacterium]